MNDESKNRGIELTDEEMDNVSENTIQTYRDKGYSVVTMD